ncbi:MAG: fibronectin type III domain-containing protein [Opitutales bacterium]|nr:fibronectin type III domain-containing protein [Opitutales bacterium]
MKAVILLGRIPVPYSGDINPDAHSDHKGAWPADTYYADLTGTWTDDTVNNTSANQSRNHNVPGDGKFDQNALPESANIAVGRIDMANLSGFEAGNNETDLLRNYLRKNHEFRHQLNAYADLPERAFIRDALGSLNGESPASVAWRSFTPMFGPTEISTPSNWFDAAETEAWLWGYGSGPGSFTSASTIGNSGDFKTRDSLVVFNALFGSYFGDWDSPSDNFLRAPLAGAEGSLGLISLWANRPDWHLHGMALGETIGEAYFRTVNNPGDWNPHWSEGYFNRYTAYAQGVHTALMGDPTLRLHPVAAPETLTITRTPGGSVDTVDLSWEASVASGLVGYHIYRSADLLGEYTRLTASPVGTTTYTDMDAPQTLLHYQVRPVVLTESASGTYFNAGQAAFFTIPVDPPVTPSDLSLTTIDDQSIQLDWTYAGEDAESFRIERRPGGTGDWNEITTLDGSVRSYLDTGLNANTAYDYRVIAVNSIGESEPSDSASATTLAGELLVFDPFTDGNTSDGDDPLDVNWSTTGGSFTVVQDSTLDPEEPHNVAELYMSTSNSDNYIYFTLPEETTVEIGQRLRVHFNLRHTGTPRDDSARTGVSFAWTPNNSPWNNEENRDYFFWTSYGNEGTLGSIRRTHGFQVLNNTGGTTTLASNTQSVDMGTSATSIMMEVERLSADAMAVRYQLGEGPVQEAIDDGNDIITTFNRIFFRFRTRDDPENPGEPRFRVDNVTVEKISGQEPESDPEETPVVFFESAPELTDAFRANHGSMSLVASGGLNDSGALATTGNPQLLYRPATFSPDAAHALGIYVQIGEEANSGYDSVTSMLGFATRPTMNFQGSASDPNVFIGSRLLNLSNNGGYRLEILNKTAPEAAQSTIASGSTFSLTNGTWYYVRQETTQVGDNTLALTLEVYDADADGTVGDLVTSLTEEVINAEIAADTRLWAMLRSRRDGNAAALDNFSISEAAPAPASMPTFVMSGQSNAVGYRSNDRSALPVELQGPLVGIHGAWLVGNKDGDILVPFTSDGWDWLEVQNLGTTNGAFWPHEEGFGPEITLADRLHSHYDEDIAVIKFAVNGASLFENYDPENTETSGYYDALWDFLIQHRHDLENILDQELHWEAFFWMQGESDASSNSPQPDTAEAYAANLTDFIEAIRDDLSAPDMFFVASHINPRSGNYTIERNTVINEAMLTVASNLSHVRVSPTTDLYPASGDDIHFNSHQTQTIGHRLADAFLKTPANVSLLDLVQTHDGTPRPVDAQTDPEGLSVTITYDGSATAPFEIGTYPVLAHLSDATFAGFAMGTLVIEEATEPFVVWQNIYFTSEELNDPELEETLWGAMADPDGDGIPNLLEYALGGNPLVASTQILPALTTLTIDEEDYIALVISRNPDADLLYTVETSTDLLNWQSGTEHVVIVSETPDNLVVRSVEPVENDSRRFMRLRVNLP